MGNTQSTGACTALMCVAEPPGATSRVLWWLLSETGVKDCKSQLIKPGPGPGSSSGLHQIARAAKKFTDAKQQTNQLHLHENRLLSVPPSP